MNNTREIMRQLAVIAGLGALALAMAAVIWQSAQAAEGWGLPDEKIVRFEAKVVDILCEISGDCPAQCGTGTRQLGLLRDSGELVLAYKNFIPFAGAAAELAPFCGKRVIADGLFSTNRGMKTFALQFVREAPAGKWRRANRWINVWAKEHGVAPDSDTAQQWFRNDPTVNTLIAKDGKLGLGPAMDPKPEN